MIKGSVASRGSNHLWNRFSLHHSHKINLPGPHMKNCPPSLFSLVVIAEFELLFSSYSHYKYATAPLQSIK